MASEQAITNEAIAKAVAEVTRVAIQAMAAAAAAAAAKRPQSTVESKMGRPPMKQPSFNWEADDKYSKLKNFRLEVNKIMSSCNTPHAKQLSIVKTFWGRKGLQFVESLTQVEK